MAASLSAALLLLHLSAMTIESVKHGSNGSLPDRASQYHSDLVGPPCGRNFNAEHAIVEWLHSLNQLPASLCTSTSMPALKTPEAKPPTRILSPAE